jgi:hypothetical protein
LKGTRALRIARHMHHNGGALLSWFGQAARQIRYNQRVKAIWYARERDRATIINAG